MLSPNPAQLKKMMEQMGVKSSELDAKKVIIELKDKTLVIEPAKVMKVEAMGQKSWQIIGKEREEESFQKGSEKHEYIPSEEDIKIIMQKTGKSRAEARKALEKTKDLAEAILLLGK